MQLGCIADDMTGACDLALMLARAGMATLLSVGVPQVQPADATEEEADAVVIALKSRTVAPGLACELSRDAGDWLLKHGARQLYFKYCSTFDSTPRGNIGPVTNTLLHLLETDFTIVCPAFPAAGRTVMGGSLYVNGVPLAESTMRTHPLTPMTDSSVVRLMDAQTRAGSTGLVPWRIVERGPAAIAECLDAERMSGRRHAVTDATTETHLRHIAQACGEYPLLTAASGLALGIPDFLRKAGRLECKPGIADLPDVTGHPLVIAGSCSEATRGQVDAFRHSSTAIAIDPVTLKKGETTAKTLVAAAVRGIAKGPVMVYSTADAAAVRNAQAILGVEESAAIVETVLSDLAHSLVEAGTRKLVVAGGETSGAVARALGIRLLRTGPEIAPGVPWMITCGNDPLCIAFKSGNFGDRKFFSKAIGMLACAA